MLQYCAITVHAIWPDCVVFVANGEHSSASCPVRENATATTEDTVNDPRLLQHVTDKHGPCWASSAATVAFVTSDRHAGGGPVVRPPPHRVSHPSGFSRPSHRSDGMGRLVRLRED